MDNKRIKYFVIDVDGTMTDAGIYYDENGNELKKFCTRDAAGFVGCPADSCAEIIEIADYVSPIKGGQGAVRDVIEYVLRGYGEWEKAISEVYGIGV